MRVFKAFVDKGKIPDALRLHISDFIAGYDQKIIEITIKQHRKQRSLAQNKTWFGLYIPLIREWLLEHSGIHFTAEECHEYIVRHVWKHTEIIITPDGKPYERRLSSVKLTTGEWESLITITKAYFAGLGLVLPDPE